jgi:alpha-glucosidase (family GH31 glycosyl hydrolase)
MRRAMRTKYSLIRYFYTQLQILSKEGGTFVKPLWFEFFDDGSETQANMSYDFMLGSALKVAINTDGGNNNHTDFYFPGDVTWCNLLDPKDHCFYQADYSKINMGSKAYDAYLHLRSGYIVPW